MGARSPKLSIALFIILIKVYIILYIHLPFSPLQPSFKFLAINTFYNDPSSEPECLTM